MGEFSRQTIDSREPFRNGFRLSARNRNREVFKFWRKSKGKRSSKNFVIPVICSFSPGLVFLDEKSESLLAEKFQLNQTFMRNIT